VITIGHRRRREQPHLLGVLAFGCPRVFSVPCSEVMKEILGKLMGL
jgi:hypothetical protein